MLVMLVGRPIARRLASGYDRAMSFTASKVFWLLVQPGNFLVGLLAIGLLLVWIGWRRTGFWLAGLAALAFVAIPVLPVGAWLLAPLENRFPSIAEPPERVDGIIVLGGSFRLTLTEDRGQVALNETAERITGVIALARRYPEARVVFTGGNASLVPGRLTESDAAARLFAELGLDPARVEFEKRSRNTFENAVYSRDLVKPRRTETWLLVTSAYHMPRAVGVFETVGWRVLPYPVDYRTTRSNGVVFGGGLTGGLVNTGFAVHEWLGLLAYRMMNRTQRLFPGPVAR